MKKILFVLLVMVFSAQQAKALDALVTSVHDGDSLRVQGIAQEIRIRYADTPELKAFTWGTQPYAAEARTALLNLCGGQIASVTKQVYDKRTKRIVANVSCQNQDVATYLIKNGQAWAYRYTATKAQKLWQATAQTNGLGLWALPNPIEPYLWRKGGMH